MYGNRRANKVGIALTVAVHLLLVLAYVMRDKSPKKAAPPMSETMVYLAAAGKPKPQPAPRAPKQAERAPLKIARLPDTITLPNERPVERVAVAPPPVAPPEQSMEERIAERRRQRAEAQEASAQPVQESEAERAMRIAQANIAQANARGAAGSDRNDTGGVFTILNRNYHSAEVKFRGWNANFKRAWTSQVLVEQGGEIDIESAIVKKMIELIRKEKPGDFVWDSHRLQRHVQLSARVQDTAALQAFLLKEFFPDYQTGPR